MVERPIVLDASVTMAWCFREKATPETDAIRDRVSSDGAVVPGHWPLEVENAVRMGERRGKVTSEEVVAFISFVRAQLIEVDQRGLATTFGDLLPLARRYQLTVYDAAYLELAVRRSLRLATLDRQMLRAAERIGIELLDLG